MDWTFFLNKKKETKKIEYQVEWSTTPKPQSKINYDIKHCSKDHCAKVPFSNSLILLAHNMEPLYASLLVCKLKRVSSRGSFFFTVLEQKNLMNTYKRKI